MILKKPKNSNYAAIVTEIKTVIPLQGCDNVQAAIILGNQVIVGKDVQVGDIGLYFPLECQLSSEYLSNNNLYRKGELNKDNTKKGYFEENGRIRCVKFRGHKSEGLFMPWQSLLFTGFIKSDWTKVKGLIETPLNIGDEFDELNEIPICNKYVVKQKNPAQGSGRIKRKASKKFKSKLVDNQFRFHNDTNMLYRKLNRIEPNSLISITYKLHGTSGISSYLLCKRNILIHERIGEFLYKIYTYVTTFGTKKFKLEETEYDYIYSSRKVIKNEELNPNAQHYYNEDIWGLAHEELKPFLQKGLTFYYEIVGYLSSGGMIQKNYDYGCESTKHAIYIYRITYTNIDGKVFEFSAKQVQDFCKKNGLNPVHELYYGFARGIAPEEFERYGDSGEFRNAFLEHIKARYNEKDCFMCNNKVPEEGCVIRIEGLDFEAYKQKSNAFYALETKLLDKGESNIEDEN